jgi:pimeloyl-ACP methyl ester carboxylesterase
LDRHNAIRISWNYGKISGAALSDNCGHWPPFEKPAEWTAQVLAFLQGYEGAGS